METLLFCYTDKGPPEPQYIHSKKELEEKFGPQLTLEETKEFLKKCTSLLPN